MKELTNLQTKYLARNVIHYEEITSTQEVAKQLAKMPLPNGTIIIAESQTKGRGTKGRTWYTGRKGENIAFTLIIYPNCLVQELSSLTIDIAKCMIKSIQKLYQIELQIKHPNDLMCHGKKVGGILTETSVQGEKVEELFIGIGMNINCKTIPEELEEIATSLQKEYHRKFSREAIITEFCNELELLI